MMLLLISLWNPQVTVSTRMILLKCDEGESARCVFCKIKNSYKKINVLLYHESRCQKTVEDFKANTSQAAVKQRILPGLERHTP